MIAHLSDIHFGRIADPRIVDALVEEVNAFAVGLVAISGDLTQRARHREFEEAAEMLRAFSAPTIVVPGNHDVYPWWYPMARMFRPLRRYRELITEDLTPSFEREGLAVLGINSAHGRTVKGGRVDAAARGAMQDFFASRDPALFKVLVVHHHLTQIQALGPHDIAHHAQLALETASASGVDLILCGHLHISHVHPLEIVPANHRVVIASAGTATSSRGRRSNRKTNYYNLVYIEPDHFIVEERRYDPEAARFITDNTTRFERVREEGSLEGGRQAPRRAADR